MSRTIGDVVWLALRCAKDERLSLIDAYRGDRSEQVVRRAIADVKAFERLQLKLFGTTRNRGDALIDKMKRVDILGLLAENLDLGDIDSK